MLQILELESKWNDSWKCSPGFILEEKLGEKKTKRCGKILDNLHISQISVMSAFKDFSWLYRTGSGTGTTVKHLGTMYGVFDKTLKAFNVLYKAALKEMPELKDYYGDTDINVFDMMVSDIDHALNNQFKVNKEEMIARYPNFIYDFVDNLTKIKEKTDIFDVVKANFKSAEKLPLSLIK